MSDPTNNDGGKCVWAFAEKDGKEYFIKRFLEPKRPRPDSTASEISKRRRMQECEEFENRHRLIMEGLRHDSSGAGNLVLAVDLFYEGSTYYKVTERIDTTSLKTPQQLDPRKKTVLLKTLGLSLRLLHDIDVVHGDLKPGNVLIQKKPGNTFYTAKLIDFDDSYISGKPPDRDSIPGDPLFGAPEWRRYLQGDTNVQPAFLTTSVDVFALGLMTHYYLTGDLPGFHDRYGAPADAVNDDVPLRLDDRLTDDMQALVRSMTARSPGARPRLSAFLAALGDRGICKLTRRKRPHGGPASGDPVTKGATRSPDGGKVAGRRGDGFSGTALAEAEHGTPRSRLRTHVEKPAERLVEKPGASTGRGAASTPKRPIDGAAESNGGPKRTSRVRINLGEDRADRRR